MIFFSPALKSKLATKLSFNMPPHLSFAAYTLEAWSKIVASVLYVQSLLCCGDEKFGLVGVVTLLKQFWK